MLPRHMNLIALLVVAMAICVAPIRSILIKDWEDERTQVIVEASVNRGMVATQALRGYLKTVPVTFVNGKPAVGSTAVDTSDSWSLRHGPSLTGDEVEAILKGYNSPAAGVGAATVEFSKKYDIDNAYWLAMFIHESGAGSAAGWAGNKGNGHYTANTGNLIAAPGYGNYGRFADFNDDWKAGVEAHFALLAEYRDTAKYGNPPHKHETIVDAINTWAPPDDGNNQNLDDPNSYPNAVKRDVTNWRSAHASVATTTDSDLRKKVIEKALSLQGTSYSQVYNDALGFRPDCSGTVAFIYKDTTGISIGSTTYDIFPNLKPVEEKDLQPGDLWFGQWEGSPPNNEHMGIVADVNGDGKWDLIHNGADKSEQHVTESFLETYLGEHTKGFRTVLG